MCYFDVASSLRAITIAGCWLLAKMRMVYISAPFSHMPHSTISIANLLITFPF